MTENKTWIPPKKENIWPHYALYAGHCKVCGLSFYGPKRTNACWSCTPKATKDWWNSLYEEKPR